MREKRTFRAKMPTTQEAFADYVKDEKTVIVLSHSLLIQMDKELNENRLVRGAKKVNDGAAKVALLFGFIDPVAWVYSAVLYLNGGLLLRDKITGYDVYGGMDVNDENIIVLIRKENYDPKYGTIKYDKAYVKSVSEKPTKGKIKA